MPLLAMALFCLGIGLVLLGAVWAWTGLRAEGESALIGLFPAILGGAVVMIGFAIPMPENSLLNVDPMRGGGMPGPGENMMGPGGGPPGGDPGKVPFVPGPPPDGGPMGQGAPPDGKAFHPPPPGEGNHPPGPPPMGGPGQMGAPGQMGQMGQPGMDFEPILDPKPTVFARLRKACSTLDDGGVSCWGEPEPAGEKAAMIALGTEHGCSLMLSGHLNCWGDEDISPGSGVRRYKAISANLQAMCGLTLDGQIQCWGETRGTAPRGSGFTQISGGAYHSCAVASDGSIRCWGCDAANQSACTAPEGPFTEVSAGHFHTCGLRADGSAECWGANTAGQSDVPSNGRFKTVSAGWHHSCGIQTDGTLACWGCKVRNPGVMPEAVAHCSPPSGQFSALAAGDIWSSCALTPIGARKCWGGLPRMEE